MKTLGIAFLLRAHFPPGAKPKEVTPYWIISPLGFFQKSILDAQTLPVDSVFKIMMLDYVRVCLMRKVNLLMVCTMLEFDICLFEDINMGVRVRLPNINMFVFV